ncbi:MAG: MFS transporter [Anaerofustis sp.]
MEKPKVNQKIVTIFGLSELAAILIANLSTQYFSFYITDILLYSPVVMGTVLIFTRTFDIATILISGVVEEKMNPKWGKYRSWLLMMIPIAAVVGIVQYANIGGAGKLIVASVCYVLFFGFFNFGRTAQLALLNSIGSTPEDRAMLSARKGQFASLAGIIFNATFLPLALFFSGAATKTDIKPLGFLLTVVVFQAVYLIPQMILFKASKPYDMPVTDAQAKQQLHRQKLSGKEMLEQVFKNPPLLLLLLAEICKTVVNTLVLSMAVYYFKVVAQDLTLSTIFTTAISVTGFVGTIFIGQFVMKKVGKKYTYVMGFGLPIIAMIIARLVAANNSLLFICIMCVAWFFFLGISIPGPAMFGDCVEYGKYKIGKEGRAFVMSLYTLPIKIGVLIAGGVSGYLLGAIGYSASATITPQLQSGLFNLVTFAPAAFLAVGLICALCYPLTEKRTKEIMQLNQSAKTQTADR